ncbi:hypothetical protein ACFVWN_00890 [Nocardiopsis flavescens]|uniref:hypothetical protein n=1 Tax=Nocardiopsis flavescens TaxID=758803 RepID=UPI00364A93D4
MSVHPRNQRELITAKIDFVLNAWPDIYELVGLPCREPIDVSEGLARGLTGPQIYEEATRSGQYAEITAERAQILDRLTLDDLHTIRARAGARQAIRQATPASERAAARRAEAAQAHASTCHTCWTVPAANGQCGC